MKEKILISITGKSGVGKSIFSNLLANKLNAELLSLDNISHISLEDSQIKIKLKKVFGQEIFDKNDNIIRKKLGSIAFQDKSKLEYLNKTSLEFMENYIDKKIDNSTKKYIILEYALLPQMKYFEKSKFKILLTSNDETRYSRILKRDNITSDYLKNRENNLPDYKNAKFDEIIENNTEFEQNLLDFAEKISKKIQTSI